MRRTSRAASRKSPKRKPARAKPTAHSFISFLSADAQLIAIVSLVAIVFLCYVNTLGNEFVFDDFILVLASKRIRSINLGRSEERRVGKEGKSRWWAGKQNKHAR